MRSLLGRRITLTKINTQQFLLFLILLYLILSFWREDRGKCTYPTSSETKTQTEKALNLQATSLRPSPARTSSTTLLPDRLIVVYGLESSGTTFVSKTLSLALGLKVQDGLDARTNREGSVRLQHISLPTGSIFSKEPHTISGNASLAENHSESSLPIVSLLPPFPLYTTILDCYTPAPITG